MKDVYNGMETDSFIIRDKIITGNTQTVYDSVNSRGVIASFKSMSTPKKIEQSVKRESILKMVLMQNVSPNIGNIYNEKFFQENFDSDVEDS